ncbi:hypothetical protein L1887_17596 [Cichorium endivia]|nr:hypothetical protein L1887_17596 [Cichorium endivia]
MAAQAHNGWKEKDSNEYDPDNNGSGDDFVTHEETGKINPEPNFDVGRKEPTNKDLEKEAQSKTNRTDDNVIDPDRYDALTTLKNGEVSDKLKKLLSRKLPIEEKLLNSWNNMEKRITRSQAKKKRREEERNNKKDSLDLEIGSDSSMSVGVLQRLAEVGRLSRLKKGGVGGKPLFSTAKEGCTKGKL